MPTTEGWNQTGNDMSVIRFMMCALGVSISIQAQGLPTRQDEKVPAQVDLIYERGLRYLAEKQNGEGYWDDGGGSEPGVVGLCVAAFLAHGNADDLAGGDIQALQKMASDLVASHCGVYVAVARPDARTRIERGSAFTTSIGTRWK